MSTVKAPANYAPAACKWCQGDGRVGKTGCPACDAQGSVLVAQPLRYCDYCYGRGHLPQYKDIPCWACGGSGWSHPWLV